MDARTQLKDLARDVAELSDEREGEQVRIEVVYVDRSNPQESPKAGMVATCPMPPDWRPQ